MKLKLFNSKTGFIQDYEIDKLPIHIKNSVVVDSLSILDKVNVLLCKTRTQTHYGTIMYYKQYKDVVYIYKKEKSFSDLKLEDKIKVLEKE